MKKSVLAGIIAGVVVTAGAGGYFILKNDTGTKEKSTTANSTHEGGFEHDADGHHLNHTAADMAEALDTAPTREQVTQHGTKDDCWTIVDKSVYNLTSFIKEHPGGDNILSACGVDATEYFKGEKAGQEGGKKDHSNSNEAFEHLGTLKLGELAE
jgi:cytochrome b involved in lipid metabolism